MLCGKSVSESEGTSNAEILGIGTQGAWVARAETGRGEGQQMKPEARLLGLPHLREVFRFYSEGGGNLLENSEQRELFKKSCWMKTRPWEEGGGCSGPGKTLPDRLATPRTEQWGSRGGDTSRYCGSKIPISGPAHARCMRGHFFGVALGKQVCSHVAGGLANCTSLSEGNLATSNRTT